LSLPSNQGRWHIHVSLIRGATELREKDHSFCDLWKTKCQAGKKNKNVEYNLIYAELIENKIKLEI
jgi:ribosomal protein L20